MCIRDRYEDAQVTAAVRRELLRGGQVFYVHNRVQDIASVAAKIHELVPESHVGIAHGKMGEKQLDGVIRDFWPVSYTHPVTEPSPG